MPSRPAPPGRVAPAATPPRLRDVHVFGAIGMVELDYVLGEHGIACLEALRQYFIAMGVWLKPLTRVVCLTPSFTVTNKKLAVPILIMLHGLYRYNLRRGKDYKDYATERYANKSTFSSKVFNG